jgi:hypothetical protein
MTLLEVTLELFRRLTWIFLQGPDDWRPVHSWFETFPLDLHRRDLVLLFEYLHGGRADVIDACHHQTGWTGLVAQLLQQDRG